MRWSSFALASRLHPLCFSHFSFFDEHCKLERWFAVINRLSISSSNFRRDRLTCEVSDHQPCHPWTGFRENGYAGQNTSGRRLPRRPDRSPLDEAYRRLPASMPSKLLSATSDYSRRIQGVQRRHSLLLCTAPLVRTMAACYINDTV
jgi:hypothetical protein